MDWLLIGSLWGGVTAWFSKWGLVILGLGLLIFIHELGHFLVAKWCGVKCEKFYLGFDVPFGRFFNWILGREGELKIFGIGVPRTIGPAIKWGETEYGIGIVPLGGYVKMLGQDDNPYAQEEEFERARGTDQPAAAQATEAQAAGSSRANAPSNDAASATATDAAPRAGSRWDPRSYLAKSVPQRMAIISAGVIMNAFLAVVLATIAYSPGMGVKYTASVIGYVSPGGAAWKHNIPVGAEITRVDDITDPRFEQDLRRVTVMTRKGRTVNLEYIDPDTKQTHQVALAPEMGEDKLARLGIMSSFELQLRKERVALPGSPAAEADFRPGDRIVAVEVDGKRTDLATFAQLQEALVRDPDKTLQITVERAPANEADAAKEAGARQLEAPQRATFALKPMPTRDVGLIMKLGKITHVQPQSPAEKAGVLAGDELIRVTTVGSEENLSADPLFLAELLRRRAGQKVNVVVMRDGAQKSFEVELRPQRWSEEPRGGSDQPMSAPSLGIAYQVQNEIADVVAGSPAEQAGLKRGQKLDKVEIVPPPSTSSSEDPEWNVKPVTIELGPKKLDWPVVFFSVQDAPEGTKLKVFADNQKNATAELTPVARSDWFRPERGLLLAPIRRLRVATSFGDALRLGLRETGEAMTMVVQFLQRIPDLWRHTAGPIGIVDFAGRSVDSGFTTFLLFLTMLSANLAVVNILPIPVLDGGHLVFLTYEGIRGKPPSEKLFLRLNAIGLLLILGVMLLVISLDIGRLFGG